VRIAKQDLLNHLCARRPDAKRSIDTWMQHMRGNDFRNFAELRNTFGSADVVGDCIVFDIRGNRYRLIANVDFAAQTCRVKSVLTHSNYDRNKWMKTINVKDAAFSWPAIEFCDTVPPVTCAAEHAYVSAILDYLGDHGATREGSPQAPLYRKLFDVLYDYEQVHHPYL
jgi:mRNA interferase HigB